MATIHALNRPLVSEMGSPLLVLQHYATRGVGNASVDYWGEFVLLLVMHRRVTGELAPS